MISPYEMDVKQCVATMKNNGVILYPTDTIWGIGCDAHNVQAIEKIFDIKKRDKHKSFVLLMTDVKQLSKYLANPLPDLESIVEKFTCPTTVIYENAINLPDKVLGSDSSVAVRITTDPFCRSMIKRLRSPIVSTSANLSGEPGAAIFSHINKKIIEACDYVVKWRQNDEKAAQPSTILKLTPDGSFVKIR